MDKFCMGHASASDWRGAVEACVERLKPPPGANLGFVYVTDELAADVGKITDFLVRHTGVAEWVGTTGIGICATGREYFDEPAVAAMAGCPGECNTRKGNTLDASSWRVVTHPVARAEPWQAVTSQTKRNQT